MTHTLRHVRYSIAFAFVALALLPFAASAELVVTTTPTDYTVVNPFERSYRFVMTVENTGTLDEEIAMIPGERNEGDWLNIYASGVATIEPGETVEFVTTFEPHPREGGAVEPLEIDYEYAIGGQDFSMPLSLEAEEADLGSLGEDATIEVKVTDSAGEFVPNVDVQLSLIGGIEAFIEQTDGNGVATFPVPSKAAVEEMLESYGSRVVYGGYYVSVQTDDAYGFAGPVYADESTELTLAPAENNYTYELVDTVQTEFALWYLKANDDFSVVTTSAGAHPDPDTPRPSEVSNYGFNPATGEELWQNRINTSDVENVDVCWGLDIADDGSYVAMGCYNDTLFVYDSAGNEVATVNTTGPVRWVDIAPNGEYIAFGPTESQADGIGVYSLPSMELQWEARIGDWARTATFSNDSFRLAVGVSNGSLQMYDVETGERMWQGSNGGLVPFLSGFPGTEDDVYVSAGKGLQLMMYNVESGELQHRIPVDHVTSYGEVADNGLMVFGTVANSTYGVMSDGTIRFRRENLSIIHNGITITPDGTHVLVGGNNPTLLDEYGRTIWEKDPSARQEEARNLTIDEEMPASNAVAMSNDASQLAIGYDDGTIEFWKRTAVEENDPSTYSIETSYKNEPAGPLATVDSSEVRRAGQIVIVFLIIVALVVAGAIIIRKHDHK